MVFGIAYGEIKNQIITISQVRQLGRIWISLNIWGG